MNGNISDNTSSYNNGNHIMMDNEKNSSIDFIANVEPNSSEVRDVNYSMNVNDNICNTVNDGESNISNPVIRTDSDKIAFINNCDNKDNREKTGNLNVTFSFDKGNNLERVDDINATNSMNGNTSDNTSSYNNGNHIMMDNEKNSSIDFVANVEPNSCEVRDVNYSMNVNDNICNGNDLSILDNIIDINNSTNINFDDVLSYGNDKGCKFLDDNNINAINSHNSDNNELFVNLNGSGNNSETGIVINGDLIFPFDINSNILDDDNATAKTSASSSNNVDMILPCNDTSDNIASATNITNISEYLPSTSETTVETEIVECERNHVSTNNDKNSSVSLIDISSVNAFGCREENLSIPFSQPKGLQKKNFCYYCKKFQSKIARHLENVHKLEPEVQKFILLPKGNLERKKIIETIRKKGNFIHNTDPSLNTGTLVVCRRPAEKSGKSIKDYTCCAKCKGWHVKNNIRHHFKECAHVPKGRNVQILGRAVMGRIHECASETVRKFLFPVLREDDVTRCIRYDKLLITYANKLCIKYTHQHQQDMIRARLRLLGRFLIAIKEYNSIVTEFSDIYNPAVYDDCLKAVNKVADFNCITKKFGAPSVASNIGTYLKHIGNLLITENIKTNDKEKQEKTENFLKILQEDYGTSINKIVEENITQHKRQKKVTLPSMEDIKKLHSYLSNQRRLLYTKLQKKFTFHIWQDFAKVTLTSTQVFNRRRAGEIERVTIEDFNTREGITKKNCSDLYKTLKTNLKQIADKYVRFLIRGKLGRTVPVILDMEIVQCIELILKYRKDANVPQNNPYVFGIPNYSNKRNFKYLRACVLMRNFSKKCDAQMPHALRGTELRKHIATTCITLNLSENEVDDLANFMGHHEKIHKRHYRQSIPAVEIIRMTKFLEAALGEDAQQSNANDPEETVKDSSSEREESDSEKSEINESLSVQSESKFFETNITKRRTQQKSAILNNDYNSDEIYIPKMKKRRSTSPFGITKRRHWTEEERNTIFKEFAKEIAISQLPSAKKIVQVKDRNKCLVNRSVAQIKTWIHNYITGKIKRI
ncbi:uncharacterized protein LOC120359603 isoform X2 [Solenopsis invicta]|nr:uncharacterized protein LOC120357056 isoform X2 [Solenopsis invicta]XP_039303667.1 uncharacterized protein LOC105199832 isoform X2 [Solenopsis invicta]XP_039313580.1 uncharacterized protein LOC120359603 isoform X2 [Solenopsis invicta]